MLAMWMHLVALAAAQSGLSCSLPKLGLDVAGTGGAGLDLLLLLLPQDPLCQQVVRGCDVVVFIGLQGSERTQSHETRTIKRSH